MTITRKDIEDLRPGDVVEITRDEWPAGSAVRGPLTASDGLDKGLYLLDGFFGVRDTDGGLYKGTTTLTVIKRKPRPYVNHDRETPVRGDVARDAEDPWNTRVWLCDGAGDWWTEHDETVFMARSAALIADDIKFPKRLRLLVDGEKGDIVQ